MGTNICIFAWIHFGWGCVGVEIRINRIRTTTSINDAMALVGIFCAVEKDWTFGLKNTEVVAFLKSMFFIWIPFYSFCLMIGAPCVFILECVCWIELAVIASVWHISFWAIWMFSSICSCCGLTTFLFQWTFHRAWMVWNPSTFWVTLTQRITLFQRNRRYCISNQESSSVATNPIFLDELISRQGCWTITRFWDTRAFIWKCLTTINLGLWLAENG